MRFVRSLGILGGLIALSIALGLYFDGSLLIWVIGAWILSAPVILLDAWIFTSAGKDSVSSVKTECNSTQLSPVSTDQPKVRALSRRRSDD